VSTVSKSFPEGAAASSAFDPALKRDLTGPSGVAIWSQIALGYGLLEAALWTPQGRLDLAWMILTAGFIFFMAFHGPYSVRQMGLTSPARAAIGRILLLGLILATTVWLLAALTGADSAPTHAMPLRTTWQYVIWAFLQQFMLQSFFFLRLETLLGSKRAVLATTVLFATAHLPNPILTVGSFFAGLFFCEMFRRYRNIFPLGLVHVTLGLTMAASVSDALLHHMRVGIGYLQFR
jgi:Type II CAAX prenyl endopeptidase Rce1-like